MGCGLWAQHTFVYSLRVSLALGRVMAVCWSVGRIDLVMPVLLGVIACALAETDDSLRGRLRAVLVTMGCFVAVAFALQALAAHVVLFGLALPAAASGISFWQRPLPLLAGAVWYGAISLVWTALFAHQPVQRNLALLFDELAEVLWIKSSMFEPVRGIDVARRRIGTGTVASNRMRRYLDLYFIAQDVTSGPAPPTTPTTS